MRNDSPWGADDFRLRIIWICQMLTGNGKKAFNTKYQSYMNANKKFYLYIQNMQVRNNCKI